MPPPTGPTALKANEVGPLRRPEQAVTSGYVPTGLVHSVPSKVSCTMRDAGARVDVKRMPVAKRMCGAPPNTPVGGKSNEL